MKSKYNQLIQDFWPEILNMQNMVQLILVILLTDKKRFEALEILTQLSCFKSASFLLRLDMRNISSLMLAISSPFSHVNSYCSPLLEQTHIYYRQILPRDVSIDGEFL